MNDHYKVKYEEEKGFLNSLKKAKEHDDYYLVMEGDDGGQIYLSCPTSMINCNEETLAQILVIIDENQWRNFDVSMRTIFYEQYITPDMIPGGMGGGLIQENDIWVHEEIEQAKEELRNILTKKQNEADLEKSLERLRVLLPKKHK